LLLQVMPGLLLCFVMRYDAYKKSQLLHFGETGVPPPRHLGRIRQEYILLWNCDICEKQKDSIVNFFFFVCSYFHCSLIGYFLGLVTATVSSEIFKAAQPALLYLVPFTLLPLLTMAYLKVIFILPLRLKCLFFCK